VSSEGTVVTCEVTEEEGAVDLLRYGQPVPAVTNYQVVFSERRQSLGGNLELQRGYNVIEVPTLDDADSWVDYTICRLEARGEAEARYGVNSERPDDDAYDALETELLAECPGGPFPRVIQDPLSVPLEIHLGPPNPNGGF
jgi:hypothetical protein